MAYIIKEDTNEVIDEIVIGTIIDRYTINITCNGGVVIGTCLEGCYFSEEEHIEEQPNEGI